MALFEIDYEPHVDALPPDAQALVDAAESRFEEFYARQLNKRYPRYIASDPAQVYAAISWVKEHDLVLGNRFIEWGSGFGIATGLAALLGFEASGIELRRGLVEIARELLARQQIEADFLCTSYIPDGFIEYETASGSDLIPDDSFGQTNERTPIYLDGEKEIEIGEIDLFYAYPWPGEQEMMLKLFEHVATADSILIAYFGDREVCIYRKL